MSEKASLTARLAESCYLCSRHEKSTEVRRREKRGQGAAGSVVMAGLILMSLINISTLLFTLSWAACLGQTDGGAFCESLGNNTL